MILSVCITVFSLSAYHIYDYWKETQDSQRQNDVLIDKAVETAPQTQQTENGQTESAIKPSSETAPITVDFERLQEENKDIIAWLYCPDTEINYPVVQSKDNEYYLRRLLDGTWNIAGTLFMDYRNAADCSDLHTIIYGHNMKNNTMFGSLPKYSKQEYYEEHSVLYLLTPKQNYKVKLIAGYVTPSDSKVYEFEKTKEERSGLLKTALDNSLFTSGTTVSDEDRLLTLSTCSYEYDNARFVLMGILKEIG